MMRGSTIVDDIMTKEIVEIDEESFIHEAKELMTNHDLRKVIVTRNGKPAYVLEEWKTWGKDGNQKIKTIAGKLEPVFMIQSGTSLENVRQQLEEKPAIVVMDKERGKMVGVLTATDLMKLIEQQVQRRPWEQKRM